MQTCPICHATPNKFNDLSNRLKGLFLPDPNSLQYGISSLHASSRLLDTPSRVLSAYSIPTQHKKVADEKRK